MNNHASSQAIHGPGPGEPPGTDGPISCQIYPIGKNKEKPLFDLSSRQEPSVTAGRSLFSPLPPAFAVVPQYLFHIPVDLLPLFRTGQAAFPYIRLFGGSFSKPPLYDTGSGLCESWV